MIKFSQILQESADPLALTKAINEFVRRGNPDELVELYEDKAYAPFFEWVRNKFKEKHGSTITAWRGLSIPRKSYLYDEIADLGVGDAMYVEANDTSLTSWTLDKSVPFAFAYGWTDAASGHIHEQNMEYGYDFDCMFAVGLIAEAQIKAEDVIIFYDMFDDMPGEFEDVKQPLYGGGDTTGLMEIESEVTVYTPNDIESKITQITAYINGDDNKFLSKLEWGHSELADTWYFDEVKDNMDYVGWDGTDEKGITVRQFLIKRIKYLKAAIKEAIENEEQYIEDYA